MAKAKKGAKKAAPSTSNNAAKDELHVTSPYTASGVLASLKLSRDIKIEQSSINIYGIELLQDSVLELNHGRRYGLIGLNGCGKSTLLKCISERQLPIPEHIDIYHLDREVEASDLSALEAVLEHVNQERERVEAELEELAASEDQASIDRVEYLYECLDELDIETAPSTAGKILHGLGFNKEMQQKKTKDFSGGWRMRIALARALFTKPTLMVLDEPTNHLDLEAVCWLEDYLAKYNRILLLVSHSQDFLNAVCTNIIHMQNKKLNYYSGDYDTYIKTRAEKEENQMKQYAWEQDQISHMKDYINRFGHGSAKLARQAKSKEKTLARMTEKGLTERVAKDHVIQFRFPDCGTLPPPVLSFTDVCFGYTPERQIYYNINFGVDLDSRIALVGPNGAGKSTLLKLMVAKVTPTNGMVRSHQHLRIAYYHQHLSDQLDLDLSPLQFMMKNFAESYGYEEERMRGQIGRYGVTGKTQTTPIRLLSDGMKSRVVFAWLAFSNPHLLLLDEPTNHLDLETIDALADAINEFEGGVVLVSHDFRLIDQVAEEIWVCDNGNIEKWQGDIRAYKNHLRKKLEEEELDY